MSIDVEVNLRIPAVKNPVLDDNRMPINNADVRFIKLVSVPAIPKPGTLLQIAAKDATVECEVHRADWNEGNARFIVYCKYSKRSISADEYHALINDSAWEMRPLL